MILKVILLFLYVVFSEAAYEGEPCFKDGVGGVCTNLKRCQTAIADLKNRRNPQICSFDGTEPIVCCLGGKTAANPSGFGATLPQTRPPVIKDTEDSSDEDEEEGECEALDASMTPSKTGQKAFDKCIEYQEQLVYPCERGASILGDYARSNYCHHNADELIIGGNNSAQYEFPHMVMLGYGKKVDELQWQCGGTLISERFILTAGHCIKPREGPNYLLVGALRRSETSDRSKLYKVKNIIRHPKYSSPNKYHDIALIETEKQIRLDQFTVPACIHTGDEVNDTQILATGWGLTQYNTLASVAEILQKVILSKFSTAECSRKYTPNRLMLQGFDAQSQTCYGDREAVPVESRNQHKDTCQGDSGGPIQIKSQKIYCMYTVVGVTSFGRACGFGDPGIYTRVANYVPWIESVVWPN